MEEETKGTAPASGIFQMTQWVKFLIGWSRSSSVTASVPAAGDRLERTNSGDRSAPRPVWTGGKSPPSSMSAQ